MSIAELIEATPSRRKMTVEEFLALPADGVDRMLLDGEVWETGMTVRNRSHAKRAARITTKLTNWNDAQPLPRGEVTVGDPGFRLAQDSASVVGPDVAYASAELVARIPDESTYYEGPPDLAVEILSPSDKMEDVVAKVRKYLQAGTVVWEVNPEYRSVLVHRPGMVVEMYNITQELVGDPYLPGFRVAVAEFFED